MKELGLQDAGISPISSSISVPPSANSNLPARVRMRAGERAALVSEQLALQELGRQRRAIDLHERTIAAAATAGAALAR